MKKKLYKSHNLITGTWKAKVFYACVILIPVLQFAVFYFGVLLNSVLLSFKDYNMKTGEYVFGAGVDNFRLFFFEFFSSTSTLKSMLINSLIAWFGSTGVGVTLALMFSYYIAKKMAGSGFYRIMLFLPTIISTIAMSLIYRRFIDRFFTSSLNDLFHLGLTQPFSGTPDQRFTACLIFSVLIGFGTQVLMYSGVMSRIPTSIVEYASLDGINAFQEFIHITLPLIYPTITTFLVASVGGYFTNQMYMYDIYGSHALSSIQTIGYYLYNNVAGDGASFSAYPKMSAYGVIFTLVAVPITLLAKWGLERFDPCVEY